MATESTVSRNLLVLDLDETLIYACEEPLDRSPDFMAFQYCVYRRPYLDAFLAKCTEYFELAVWSSASDEYVEFITRKIIPSEINLQFVWGRSRASLRRVLRADTGFSDPWDHMNYRKPLAKLKRYGWPLERVLILDDTPSKSQQNYGNAIYPKEFLGDERDDELLLLTRYLPTLADCPNVRRIEKRNWREKALKM